MARETERGLDLGAPLTLEEAATLADVSLGEIEALVRDGTLLSERQRTGGLDVTVVRLIDLGDVYPRVVGRAPSEERTVDRGSKPAGDEASTPQRLGSEATIDLADSVRASGANRDALIDLCQDLETRLDLAERERQASTASLLMAQRRVLDLEVLVRRRPWYADGAKLAAAAGIGAAVLALVALLRVPTAVEQAVAEERESFAQELGDAREDARATLLNALAEARDERHTLEASIRALDAERQRERLEIERDAEARLAAKDRVLAEERTRVQGERVAFQTRIREDLKAELTMARDREKKLAQQVVEAVQELRELEEERAAAMLPPPPPPSNWYETLIRRERIKD